YLITENLLPYLTSNELIIDLALPSNVHPRVAELPEITFVDLKCIQQSIQSNMAFREEAIKDGMSIVERNKLDFKKMVQARNVERAMRAIPETIKSIKQTAVEQVFRKEIESLDEHSKQIVFDIIQYMEKKYISVPMKMAKDVLLEEISKN
ncbi:MAG: glutamyl-tRNA reductase, partial [Bacteroidota bacterium]